MWRRLSRKWITFASSPSPTHTHTYTTHKRNSTVSRYGTNKSWKWTRKETGRKRQKTTNQLDNLFHPPSPHSSSSRKEKWFISLLCSLSLPLCYLFSFRLLLLLLLLLLCPVSHLTLHSIWCGGGCVLFPSTFIGRIASPHSVGKKRNRRQRPGV